MKNENWYFVVDLNTLTAKEYTQLAGTWANITGFEVLDDATLADLRWAGHDIGFWPEAKCIAEGVDTQSMTDAKYAAREVVREHAKKLRALNVERLKVTTQAGNTYDADEVSINRMTAAITVMMATGQPVPWVLADNSVILADAAELTEALALSAAAVAAIWVIPA